MPERFPLVTLNSFVAAATGVWLDRFVKKNSVRPRRLTGTAINRFFCLAANHLPRYYGVMKVRTNRLKNLDRLEARYVQAKRSQMERHSVRWVILAFVLGALTMWIIARVVG